MLMIALPFIYGGVVSGYDQTDRYQLLEDRNFIQRRISDKNSLNGIYFNISSHISSINFLSESSSLADSSSSADAFTSLYNETDNQELATFVNLEVIIPLRKIEMDEFSLTPKIYARADFGVLSYGQSRAMTEEEFDAFVLHFYSDADDIKTIREILNFVTTLPSAGENVFQHFIDAGACNTTTLLNFCNAKNAEANTPVMPGDSESKLFIYNKTQFKAGVLWDFNIIDDWTGYINIYGLQRGDHMIALDDNSAAASPNKLTDFITSPLNNQQFVMLDAKFQINYRPFKIHFLMEELKITRWKDQIDEHGDLYYRNTSLYQLYLTYSLAKGSILMRPFGGYHKRRGYGLSDGLFLGIDLNNLKTLSKMRLMVDGQNVTIRPSLRFGDSDLIYQIQLPFSSTVEESIATEAIHSLQFSVAI